MNPVMIIVYLILAIVAIWGARWLTSTVDIRQAPTLGTVLFILLLGTALFILLVILITLWFLNQSGLMHIL